MTRVFVGGPGPSSADLVKTRRRLSGSSDPIDWVGIRDHQMLLTFARLARLVSIIVFAAASTPSFGQTVLQFGEGAAEVTVPARYLPVKDNDASLVVLSRPEGNVRLYFDLHKLDAAVKAFRPGEALVREQALKKGRQLEQQNGKVLFLDPSPVVREGTEAIVNLHWQIGFDKTLVVMSARIPKAARDAPDVRRFLSDDVGAITASLRRID